MHVMQTGESGALRSQGYKSGRSPIGLGGTIAVHALVVVAWLLIPKEMVEKIIPPGILTTSHIPIPPPPEPVEQPKVEAKVESIAPPLRPTAPDKIVDLRPPITDLTGDVRPIRPFDPDIINGTGMVKPVDPPPLPVLVDASIDPRALDSFQPDYPGSMIRQAVEGSVKVRVTINAKGRVVDIERISATDNAFWLATQRHALRKWRFRPATRDGVAVSSSKVLTVRFTLTDR